MSDYRDRPLIEYLPDIIREVREYRMLIEAEQPEIFRLFEGIEHALINQFVVTATEYGIGRWEKLLEIAANPAVESIEFRRKRILHRLSSYAPYTERTLQSILDDICGDGNWDYELDIKEYKLIVYFEDLPPEIVAEVRKTLKHIIPANLIFMPAIVTTTPNDTQYLRTGGAFFSVTSTTLPKYRPP